MANRWLPSLAVHVLEHAADIESPAFVNTFATAGSQVALVSVGTLHSTSKGSIEQNCTVKRDILS